MTAAGRGDAPTPQDAATDEHFPWHYTEFGVECVCGSAMNAREECLAAAGPVPVAADVPTPSAATQNDEAQR